MYNYKTMSSKMPTLVRRVLSDRQASYLPGQQINIEIPADLSLLASQETFLRCRVLMKSGDVPVRCGLRSGYNLIDRIDVMTGANQTRLETLENVAGFMSVRNAYNSDLSRDNIMKLQEGYCPTIDTSILTQYYDNLSTPAEVGTDNDAGFEFKLVELVLPIYMSGILSSKQIYPLVASDGLNLRITLNTAERAIEAFTAYGFEDNTGGIMPNGTLLPANPDLLTNASNNFGSDGTDATAPATGGGMRRHYDLKTAIPAGGAGFSTFVLSRADQAGLLGRGVNAMDQVAICPGQTILMEETLGGAGLWLNIGKVQKIEVLAPANEIQITLDAPFVPANAINAHAKICCRMMGINYPLAAGGQLSGADVLFKPTFEVQDVEMVCGIVSAPADYLEGLARATTSDRGVRFEYETPSLYRLNDEKAPQNSILVPLIESRANSLAPIVPLPTDNPTIVVNTFGSVQDNLTAYQFLFGSRLVPDLEVETNRTGSNWYGAVAGSGNPTAYLSGLSSGSWNSIQVEELEKALERCGMEVKDLSRTWDQFTIGRRLSIEGHSMNTRENEVRLNLRYQTSPEKNKLWYAYNHHIRTLICKADGMEVLV